MLKKLKIKFIKFERALVMQILEQEGEFIDTEHVKIGGAPELYVDNVFLRGKCKSLDWAVCSSFTAKTDDELDEYFDKVVKWISDEQFSRNEGSLEIGKTCDVSNDGEKWRRVVFAGECAPCLGEPRYLAMSLVDADTLYRFKYVRPARESIKPIISGDVYTWEM